MIWACCSLMKTTVESCLDSGAVCFIYIYADSFVIIYEKLCKAGKEKNIYLVNVLKVLIQ